MPQLLYRSQGGLEVGNSKRSLSCCPWTLCGQSLGVAIRPGGIRCRPGHAMNWDHFAGTEKTKPFLKA